jgi:hypothetical protein
MIISKYITLGATDFALFIYLNSDGEDIFKINII